MDINDSVLAIVDKDGDSQLIEQIGTGTTLIKNIVLGSPADAVSVILSKKSPPQFIIIDIGNRGFDVLQEVDSLAEYCELGTRVVIIGSTNDLGFYRELKARGVIEYFTRTSSVVEIRAALFAKTDVKANSGSDGEVIAFMSAASGDGTSTVALNTAYALATHHHKKVVLVDMDYQFGMAAKNLYLTSQFGIRELFDHPERGIDSTLIDRMLVNYKNGLSIIAAPNQLLFTPTVPAEVIANLINTLKKDFDMVVLDLPHVWNPITASALKQSDKIILVAQLWLRSLTHASRLLSVWRESGIKNNQISLTINRSGAKFKEAVTEHDFEKVCLLPISFSFNNDTKSVINAENRGMTVVEDEPSELSKQYKKFSHNFSSTDGKSVASGVLKSKFSKLLGG